MANEYSPKGVGTKYHFHMPFLERTVNPDTIISYFFSCTVSHLVAVLPRIDERQEDDFFRSASESDSFSSGEEDGVPAPDLREVKKKSKNKTDSQREKPPISSKRPTKPPEPVLEAEIQEEHFVAVKAENLFDISEGEEEEETPEGQDGENERFFQPEDNSDDSEDEDAKTDSKKQAKKQRGNNDKNTSESEEEMEENDKSNITKTKAVTTAVSTFLNHKEPGKESKEEASLQEAQPTEEEDQRIGTEETKEEQDDDDDESDWDKDEDDKKDKEDEDEEEEEPRVEFTGAAKPEVRFIVLFELLFDFFQTAFKNEEISYYLKGESPMLRHATLISS